MSYAQEYVIERLPSGEVTITSPDGHRLQPIPVHSPSGFDVGYLGSGPAEAAYVILRDWYSRRWGVAPAKLPALMYQDFKEDVIASLDRRLDRHAIHDKQIASWLSDKGWALDACALLDGAGACHVLCVVLAHGRPTLLPAPQAEQAAAACREHLLLVDVCGLVPITQSLAQKACCTGDCAGST